MSRPALNGLDRKLEAWLPKGPGFFVEAGANDGYQQSNTYYFEKLRGWRGVLVEPVPWLAAECARNRRASRVFPCALVPFGHAGAAISLDYSGLTSNVEGAFADEGRRRGHQAHGLAVQPGLVARSLEVPARTLQAVLEEAGAPEEFDLLSLDVEGFEPGVLDGLDLKRFRPQFILIETWSRAEIERRLLPFYREAAVLAAPGKYEDVLYERREGRRAP
jgi:FkbM family methyltransferase